MTGTLLLLASLCGTPVNVPPGPVRAPEITAHPYIEYAPGVVIVLNEECLKATTSGAKR